MEQWGFGRRQIDDQFCVRRCETRDLILLLTDYSIAEELKVKFHPLKGFFTPHNHLLAHTTAALTAFQDVAN